jgi:diaminohydroxyphosphoribosylaminopyrimidine deaminase/5-amino-6-(5-phosphoribosylamino)uracil reductase
VSASSDRHHTEDEDAAMLLAARLAWTAAGRTSPNPPVAAVILDTSGRIVGEGVTQPHGHDHAEIQALAAAGSAAAGGTAVVTLEPCNHTGRTGPCTEALIAAGIARVLYAVEDPNPVAAGGAQRLEEAGVQVLAGLHRVQVSRGAIRPWLHAVVNNRPWVTWKYASTLDGRSSAADGTSRWISNAISRADVHALRDVVDAIVVGSGTVLADDPQLTVRTGPAPASVSSATATSEQVPSAEPISEDTDASAARSRDARQPLRVVLDRRHRVPPTARVLDSAAETIVLDTAVPRFALKALFDRGVRHVLLEGGPTLAGAFLEAECVDEVIAYLAPKLLGSGAPALADAGITTIANAVSLDISEVTQLGGDIKVTGRPLWSSSQE